MPDEWIERWLGAPRFEKYLLLCAGDRQRALATYEWNVRLGLALMRDICHFEIALRNTYDRAISERWDGTDHWLLSADSPVFTRSEHNRSLRTDAQDLKTRWAISDAIARATTDDSVVPSSGKIVAELTLGVWSRFTFKLNEHNLWIPYLRYAFPLEVTRDDVHGNVMRIHGMRNRIAHHEPVFGMTPGSRQNPYSVYLAVVESLGWFAPEVAQHVIAGSTVVDLINRKP
ncbi:MAG: Abi family protein [Thermomicrobiales bacterium]|nr:Abi family protein [Thermomicrobiales bacterium]